MRTRYLVLLLSSLPLLADAQTTLDHDRNTPHIGSTFMVQRHDQFIAPGAAGEGANWSFTNLAPDATLNYEILDPSTYVPFYPAATHVIANENDTLIYTIDTDGVELIAEAVTFSLPLLGSADIHAAYTNGAVKLQYPTTYGSTWSDILNATYELDGNSVTRQGTINGHADGYGTVELPQETFDDILRIYTYTTTTETADLGSAERRLHEYSYYAEWLKFPLLKITLDSIILTSPIQSISVTGNVEWLDTLSVGLMEAYENDAAFGVWPTPANEVLNITFPEGRSGTTQAILRDLSGRTVREWTINAMGNSTVDVNGLPSGQYLLHITGETGIVGTRKVMIQ